MIWYVIEAAGLCLLLLILYANLSILFYLISGPFWTKDDHRMRNFCLRLLFYDIIRV